MINNKRSLGFTLLEILIVLGLTVFLLSNIFLIIGQSAKAWEHGSSSIEQTETEIIALNFIRRILEDSSPVYWQFDRDTDAPRAVFDGANNNLYFAAPLPVHDGQNPGIYLFSFFVDYSKEYTSKALFVSYQSINWESLPKTLDNTPKQEAILPYVEEVDFSYFGDKDLSDGGDAPEWSDSWQDKASLPLAVKINLVRSEATDENKVPVDLTPWDIVIKIPHQRLR